MSALIAYLRRRTRVNAIQQGLLGGSRPWLAVFGAGLAARAVGRARKTGPAPIVFSEELEPGEGYEIVHLPPPRTRRQRRSAARAT